MKLVGVEVAAPEGAEVEVEEAGVVTLRPRHRRRLLLAE
jgi:hypothetical protein